MTNWIKSWPLKVEFAAIILIAFSWPLLGSVASLFNQHNGHHVPRFTSYGLLWLSLMEIAALTLVLSILKIRAITVRSLGVNPSWNLTAKGILLFIIAVIVNALTVKLVVLLYPATDVPLSTMNYGKPNLIASVTLSMINPFFEEILVVGYVIASLEKQCTTGIALLSSVVLRTSYHLYLGLASAVGVAAIGLLFTFVFIKKRQLWPLIIAHGVINLLSFMALNYRGYAH